MALAEHTRTLGSRQYQLKAVGDLLKAVFYSNAGHDLLQGTSGDIERLERCGSGTALSRVFEPLGVGDGF